MKKLLIFATLIILFSPLSAQEIVFSSAFSHSDYVKFQNNFGYEIGYFQNLNLKNKVGFTFTHRFNNADYNYVFFSDGDGRNYYRDVSPHNRIYSFEFNYFYNIFNRKSSLIYIGSNLGLNYLKFKEYIKENPVNTDQKHEYDIQFTEYNKIGIGLILEYDRKIVSDNISLFISTKPEVIFFSKPNLIGSSDPFTINLINIDLGIKFKIKSVSL